MSKESKREAIRDYVAKKEEEIKSNENFSEATEEVVVKEPDVMVKRNVKRTKFSCNAHVTKDPTSAIKYSLKPNSPVTIIGEDDEWYYISDGTFIVKCFVGD